MADTPTPEVVDPTPKFVKTDLIYGVEIEAVFAFHVDQLIPYLSEGDYTVPVLNQVTRKKLTRFGPINKNQAPRLYNSRGIYRRGEADPIPYNDEPLKIVQEKLRAVRPNIKCLPTMGETPKEENTVDKYNEWIVTKDYSVTGISPTKIPDYLPYIDKTQAVQNWDTYGIEVISRVLHSNNLSHKQEIASIINGLKQTEENPSTTKTGAFITNHCALHVHVQIDKYDERFLATLAATLLIYEEEISRLHPKHRRPGHPSTNGIIESNRLRLFFSPLTSETETASQACKTLDLQLRSQHRATCRIQNIISTLSRIVDRQGKRGLIDYMNFPKDRFGDPIRDRVMNFITTDRPDFEGQKTPKTVEFRQHVGSLCPEGVGRWIDFCVGLVRLAEFWWRVPEAFPVRSWGNERDEMGAWMRSRICVFDLLRAMGADGEAIRYWEDRVARFELEGDGEVGNGGLGGDEDDDSDDNDDHYPDGNLPYGGTNGMRGSHGGDPGDDNNGQQSAPRTSTTPPTSIVDNSNKRRNSTESSSNPSKRLKTGTSTSPPTSPPKNTKTSPPTSPTTQAKQQEITTIQARLASLNTRSIISEKNRYKFESDTWDILVQRLQELGCTDWDSAKKPAEPLRDPHSPTLSILGGELYEVNQRLHLLHRTSASPNLSNRGSGQMMECIRLEIQVLEERKRELDWATTTPQQNTSITTPSPPPPPPPPSSTTPNNIQNIITPQRLNTLLSTPTTDPIYLASYRTVQSIQDLTSSIQIPQPGQEQQSPQIGDTYSHAQGNALCTEHMTVGRSSYVYVTDFNPESWTTNWGQSRLIYNGRLRRNVCGAYALYNSLRAQYPTTRTNPAVNVTNFVAALDVARRSILTSFPGNTQDRFGRWERMGAAGGDMIEGGDHSVEEMAMALEAVMGNGYQLIVWDRVSLEDHPTERAHRVGGGSMGMYGVGRNVYVMLQGYDAIGGGSGHWSGMARM